MCELLLRGPQTPGELRARVPRMAELADPSTIEVVLEGLANRPGGAIVAQLAREPGRRDSRWAQLFEELPESVSVASADEVAAQRDTANAPARGASTAELHARIASLEATVAELRAEVASLKGRGA